MDGQDKRSTQLVLPLGLTYEPQHKDIIKQHWNVTFARQGRMSVAAKRIMARVIDQVRDDEFKLRPYYQFRIVDIITDAGITKETAYKEVQGALRELTAATWEFESLDGSEWYIRHLLDTTNYQRPVGYKDGIITVLLNPALEPYFLQIAHYTKYQLSNYMSLKSWYSMRFFEILSAFRDTGVWCPTVEQYRQLMDCWHEKDKKGKVKKGKDGTPKMKYPLTKDLIKYTIAEPLEELAGTNLAFSYEPVYETDRLTRGRKKITGFRFMLQRKQDGKIPEYWLQHAVVSKVVANLRAWKVTDKNIALYLEDVGTESANKLVYDWQLKENTDDRINDRVKYCNAVFVRMGKAAQERLKQEVQAVIQTIQA
ncbi:replication initiation protein [Spirosoma utsteinense]|uniref:replication initiation protein n=1 Tax=Spirosoma utsteinense TaxID=2585773 RepID=UPI001648FF02|nr:replication initiation protein [Spirosoma utsteinense]MBC3789190.1 plasmid replication initiation protein [Spirosoma utsteinense]